jgi:hypothetical protein
LLGFLYQRRYPLKLHDCWYDTPRREGGRWVLGLRIKIEGQTTIHFYLTIPEMREVLLNLKHHGVVEGEVVERSTPQPRNTAWWAYECISDNYDDNKDGENVIFSLAGRDLEEVPVCLCRDDHFLVYLPHEIGWEMIEIIEQRLALAGEVPVAVS